MTRLQWEPSLNDAVMIPIFLDYDPTGSLHQGIDARHQDMMRQALWECDTKRLIELEHETPQDEGDKMDFARFHDHWRRLSRRGTPGRPAIAKEVRELICTVLSLDQQAGGAREPRTDQI